MSELSAEYVALTNADTQLHTIAGDLDQERRSLTSATEDLLGGDWTGPAADAFGAAFRGWSDGAASVLEGLRGMGTLIDQAKTRLEQQDDGVATRMSSLHSRLGPGA